MADFLDDFETFLTVKSLNDGINITHDQYPDSSEPCIALLAYGGSVLSTHTAGSTRPVQIRVMHESYKKARDVAQVIFSSLLSDDGVVYLTPDRWTVITALNLPIKIEEDNRGRVHFGFNIEVITDIE